MIQMANYCCCNVAPINVNFNWFRCIWLLVYLNLSAPEPETHSSTINGQGNNINKGEITFWESSLEAITMLSLVLLGSAARPLLTVDINVSILVCVFLVFFVYSRCRNFISRSLLFGRMCHVIGAQLFRTKIGDETNFFFVFFFLLWLCRCADKFLNDESAGDAAEFRRGTNKLIRKQYYSHKVA